MPPIVIRRPRRLAESSPSDDSDSDFEFLGSSSPSTAANSRAASPAPPLVPRRRRIVLERPGSNLPLAGVAGSAPREVAPLPNRPAPQVARPAAQFGRNQGFTANNAIELLDSDSDEDAVASGGVARRGAAVPRVPSPASFRNHITALDRTLDRVSRFERRRRIQEENNAHRAEHSAERLNRQVRSPPPAAGPAEPRGFGGAVLRRGPAEFRFRPGRQPEFTLLDRDEDEVDRVLRRARPVRHARDVNHPDHVPAPAQNDGQRPFIHVARNLPRIMLDAFMRPGGDLDMLMNAAGPARPMDAKAILDTVKPEITLPAREGFTHEWDPESLAKELEEKERRRVVVELDERGRVVPEKRKARRGQPYLACSACPEPLRLSSANRSPADRIWALRCGHLLDQRCITHYAEPDELPLDAPSPLKRRRSGRTRTRAVNKQHTWMCPVSGCGHEHVSVYVNEAWTPMEGLGGVQVYM